MIKIDQWTADTWEIWVGWEDTHRLKLTNMYYVEECIVQSIMVGKPERALRFALRHENPKQMIAEYELEEFQNAEKIET